MAAPGRQSQCGRTVAPFFSVTLWLLSSAPQIGGDQSQGAVFLREFTLIRRESLNEDFLPDLLNNNHKTEDTLAGSSCGKGCVAIVHKMEACREYSSVCFKQCAVV
ncbi:uncharacterized protein PHA67_007093 isoform 1-T1 [Liasis olivaceus]